MVFANLEKAASLRVGVEQINLIKKTMTENHKKIELLHQSYIRLILNQI